MWLNWVITCTCLKVPLHATSPRQGLFILSNYRRGVIFLCWPRHCWSGWICLDSLKGPQWGHTTLAKRDQIASNYAEKTSSAQGSKTATQRQKKPRLMELFQNRQNGRREAIRTFKVTLRTRKALVYRKQNQNWGKPDDVTSDATKSACASGNFH